MGPGYQVLGRGFQVMGHGLRLINNIVINIITGFIYVIDNIYAFYLFIIILLQ